MLSFLEETFKITGMVTVIFGLLMLSTLPTACQRSVPYRIAHTPYNTALYVPSDGDKYAGALKELTTRLAMHGIAVSMDEELEVFGRNYVGKNVIQVSKELSVDAKFEVLAHEAGHLFHTPGMDKAAAEIFAEMVGMQVQKFYGSDTAERATIAYLSQHKHAMVFYPIMKEDIDSAAKMLTGQLAWP